MFPSKLQIPATSQATHPHGGDHLEETFSTRHVFTMSTVPRFQLVRLKGWESMSIYNKCKSLLAYSGVKKNKFVAAASVSGK